MLPARQARIKSSYIETAALIDGRGAARPQFSQATARSPRETSPARVADLIRGTDGNPPEEVFRSTLIAQLDSVVTALPHACFGFSGGPKLLPLLSVKLESRPPVSSILGGPCEMAIAVRHQRSLRPHPFPLCVAQCPWGTVPDSWFRGWGGRRWAGNDPRQRVGDQALLHGPHATPTDRCSQSCQGHYTNNCILGAPTPAGGTGRACHGRFIWGLYFLSEGRGTLKRSGRYRDGHCHRKESSFHTESLSDERYFIWE